MVLYNYKFCEIYIFLGIYFTIKYIYLNYSTYNDYFHKFTYTYI